MYRDWALAHKLSVNVANTDHELCSSINKLSRRSAITADTDFILSLSLFQILIILSEKSANECTRF